MLGLMKWVRTFIRLANEEVEKGWKFDRPPHHGKLNLGDRGRCFLLFTLLCVRGRGLGRLTMCTDMKMRRGASPTKRKTFDTETDSSRLALPWTNLQWREKHLACN